MQTNDFVCVYQQNDISVSVLSTNPILKIEPNEYLPLIDEWIEWLNYYFEDMTNKQIHMPKFTIKAYYQNRLENDVKVGLHAHLPDEYIKTMDRIFADLLAMYEAKIAKQLHSNM